ncbi:AraC-like DNA-binding protein [Paenibacillus rhizosphaerae]|uniref:AraC-like DNA-binding protein n=1 Tax=Paenibacillus rhizosphaerae TaxID=297318 RepID=A0A839TR98_9BACL|nr:helix-turn-helix domain-containing protein [Paenibacillus rhizosphaerae]MBB3127257.1 AraC-like DNA-binding protein [Paenibacillus rhizosphaerae]
MKRNLKRYMKSKLFLKYIWSYLFILLLPLVFVTVFIYQNAAGNLREEIEQSHLNQLTQAESIVDGRMKELGEIASRIAYDDRLISYRVHDPFYSREAIDALDQYKSTSSIIGDVFLYFHHDDRIYSSQGLSSLDVFNEKYIFQNWSKDSLKGDLNDVSFPTMRPADRVIRGTYRQQSLLAYLVPITPNSPNPHATVMYLIDESELTGLIDSILGSYKGLAYIFDNHGQVLAANNHGETISGLDTGHLFSLDPGIHSVELGGKAHSVVSTKSDMNGWTYVTLMPSDQFFSSVLHIRSFIIMLFSIVVLAGIGIALLLARRQYHPISALVDFANSKSRNDRGTGDALLPGNELEHIRSALQEYSSRADLQEPYARNHLLLRLLQQGEDRELEPDLLEAFNIRFDRSQFFAIAMERGELAAPSQDYQDWQTLASLLAEVDIPGLRASAYSVELPRRDQMALIVCFDPHPAMESFIHMSRIVDAVRINILEAFDFNPIMGVGTGYSQAGQLNQSFIEACSALEFHTPSDKGGITFFEKLALASEEAFWIPKNVLMKLSQSLKQGSHDVSAHMIGEAVLSLRAGSPSPLLSRCICFDILNTMLKTASELGIHHITQEIPTSSAFQSLDEFEGQLRKLASHICTQVQQETKHKESSLKDQMLGYIDQHFMDHNLSLESLADLFEISPSHFSRTFKENVGLNFTQYIWQKRMEQVKRLLVSTQEPLKEIIGRVGYADAPNFIRKFKKETGYTPGQFRKLNHPEGALIGEMLQD